MSTKVAVAKASQLREGEGAVVQAGSEEVALFKVAGRVHACTNTCPHRGGPLGEGALDGTVVSCPWHGWEFDVTTGKMPVNQSVAVRTFAVTVDGDDVSIEL